MFDVEFRIMQQRVNGNSVAHGFYDTPEGKSIPTKLALIHSEISEALEAYRKDGTLKAPDVHCPEQSNFAIELADAVIRIMDLAEFCKVDLAGAIEAKHAYNVCRSYLHGGKTC